MERKSIIGGILCATVAFSFALVDPFNWFAGDQEFRPDDYRRIDTFRTNVRDKLTGAPLTADDADVQLPDGTVLPANTLAAGYCEWTGPWIEEGWTLIFEIDEATDHYTSVVALTVDDIDKSHIDRGYKTVGAVELWGMDQSNDAGTILLTQGARVLFNSTHLDDDLDITKNIEYTFVMVFDFSAATDEFFGIERQDRITDERYSYAPYLEIETTTDIDVSKMKQGRPVTRSVL